MGIEVFKQRRLVIATKHKKEEVIAPILEQAIGVNCFVPHAFDTDQLGTFSGEVERKLNPLETARKKCELAMDETGSDLAIASEGSFGQHPTILLAPADDEIVLLKDRKYKFEFIGRKISTDTNFGGEEIGNVEEGLNFASDQGFPEHAMILRNAQNDNSVIYKNITDKSLLTQKMNELFEAFGTAWIETDMRAMYNPKRMEVIAQATDDLIKNINNCCPVCDAPGFQVDEVEAGLPCSLCSLPTQSTLAFKYKCASCKHEQRKLYPNGKKNEEPMYCNFCNP